MGKALRRGARGTTYESIDPATLAPDDPVMLACAEIEAASWRPRVPFATYLRDASALYVASRGGAPIAFAVFRASHEGDEYLAAYDEAMTHPDHRRSGHITALTWLALLDQARRARSAGARRGLFLALTANPRAVAGLHKYRRLFPAHSFAPTASLAARARSWLERRGLQPLHDGNPFWVRAVFQGSHLEGTRFEALPRSFGVPPGFDFHRGDAFLLVAAIDVRLAWLVAHAGVAVLYGPRWALAARSFQGQLRTTR